MPREFDSADDFLGALPEGRDAAGSFLDSFDRATSFLAGTKEATVVSHLDADGLTSAAIMLTTLKRAGILADLKVVHTIDEEQAKDIAETDGKVIFVDIGSGQLPLIREHLDDRELLILDHHEPDGETHDSYVQVNPMTFGIDGNKGISGAGVTYLFSRALDSKNTDLAHLAIVGAIGDVQEDKGLSGFNELILSDAMRSDMLGVERGLRLFGAQTKPLVRLLAYNHDLSLEGITGSPDAAANFLNSIGVPIKLPSGKQARYIDLTEEERMKLFSAILIKRSHLDDPEDIIGYSYTLLKEKLGTPFRDAREFATLLNACGRMDAASIGVGAAMGRDDMKSEALRVESDYRRAIGKAIQWFKEQLIVGDRVEQDGSFMLIDGREKVRAPIIGTLASIASRMDEVPDKCLLLSYAQMDTGDLKVSLRAKGECGHDLREVMSEIAKRCGGAAGGHANAAGALIPNGRESAFVEAARGVLSTLQAPAPDAAKSAKH